jgi:hypothetical protein
MGTTYSVVPDDQIKFNVIADKKHAENLLADAEKLDFFVEECNDDPSNSLARKNCVYAPNSITDENALNILIQSNMHELPQRLIAELRDVNIVMLMPSAEGGMPHTRPPHTLCITNTAHIASPHTLIHELWHIHQRQNHESWVAVFNRLGWTEWRGTLPMALEKNRRYNPDTIDCPLWIYRNKWVPVPIFHNISNPIINDVDIWFYDANLNYHVTKPPSEIALPYTGLPPSAFEHPREITAYFLSEHRKYSNSSACKELLEYVGNISIPH